MNLGNECMRRRANIVVHLFLSVRTLVLSCGGVKIPRVVRGAPRCAPPQKTVLFGPVKKFCAFGCMIEGI